MHQPCGCLCLPRHCWPHSVLAGAVGGGAAQQQMVLMEGLGWVGWECLPGGTPFSARMGEVACPSDSQLPAEHWMGLHCYSSNCNCIGSKETVPLSSEDVWPCTKAASCCLQTRLAVSCCAHRMDSLSSCSPQGVRGGCTPSPCIVWCCMLAAP